MRKYDGRLVGILGTLIVHLIAGIIFMLFQIKTIKNDREELISLDLAPVEQTEPDIKKPEETKATTVEKIFQNDKEMLNIARNLANKGDQKVDPQQYIDMVKDEMIKKGQLGKDNFIDEQKMMKEITAGDENLAVENKKSEKAAKEEPSESQKLAANYKGPTRIYYDLTGRTHVYLPVPIYMCESSGKVVLAIEVGQRGEVSGAKVIESQSTTSDPCLVETAVKTALESRFNPDVNFPKLQEGTLTYIFVAQ